MLKFTLKHNGWEITEKGQVIFSEIRTREEALAIAKAHRVLLIEFEYLNKRAA